MEAFIALAFTSFFAFALFLKLNRAAAAIFIASMVMPTFVIYAEFFRPYEGGGASFWPIPLYVGGATGFISACIGVGAGFIVRKFLKSKRPNKRSNPRTTCAGGSNG
ncbi:hypothetical protein [Cellvibrio mixtus]|uniref:hypothetical protein n=1 Tax=Cellvibrio mixtus TaxID=39650 RepID=UPI0011404351|nr:hypothetical protein [Cellvibrio mixtus]